MKKRTRRGRPAPLHRVKVAREAVDLPLSWPDPLLLSPVPEVGRVENFDGNLVLRKPSRLRPYNARHGFVAGIETHEFEGFAVLVGARAAEHGAVTAQVLSNSVFDPGGALWLADQTNGKQAGDAFAAAKLIEEFGRVKQKVKELRAIQIVELSRLQRF